MLLLVATLSASGLPARVHAQDPATGGITGTVWDSTRAVPLAGAEVFLIGTGYVATTGEDGRFYIPRVRPGAYAISFRHARLAEYSWAAPGVAIEVNAGVITEVMLALPSEPPPLTPSRMPAPRPGSPAVLVGTVVDAGSGRGIPGATVRVRDTNIGIVTDDRGKFVLFGVPPGEHAVDVQMLGFAPRSARVSVVAGATFELEIGLGTRPIELDPVVVEVRSRELERVGFYDRLDDPGLTGHFITAVEIERRAPATFTELFTKVPGARVDYYGAGRTSVLFRRQIDAAEPIDGCLPDLYVDGMRIKGRDWTFLVPGWIGGVEVYVGADMPIQYATNPCGVILVWTNRGG